MNASAVDDHELRAYHEAGHACADWWHRLPIEFVSIQGGKGLTRLTGRKKITQEEVGEIVTRDFDIERIVCLLAGGHAERQFFSESDGGGRNDQAEALKIALTLNDGDEKGAQLLLAWCDHRAESFVKSEREQIHKLAFGLLEHDRLSGEQVRHLLGGNGRNGGGER